MKIAINGCGVAGPALAYWLLKAGHEPVLIEEAPSLRRSGYIIDFWGVGYDIAEKMGLLPRLNAEGYQIKEVRFVNSRGHKTAGFSADMFRRLTRDRFTSLKRSDLAAALFSVIEDKVEILFGNSIAAIEDRSDRVCLTLHDGAQREVDLVIGADGLHSRIRHLVFGSQDRFEVNLGLYVAAFELSGYRPRDERVYVSHTRPGRQISRFAMRDDRTLFLFVFRSEQLEGPAPTTEDGYRAALCNVFRHDGWECPEILDAMEVAENLYFDRVSQIDMKNWSKGRVALLGDAAACVSLLAGEGAGLAIAEAYVLAGELARSGGDYTQAFATYETRMMPFLRQKQATAKTFASSFAPRSHLGLTIRNLAMNLLQVPFMSDLLIGRDLRDDIILPDYQWH